MASYSHNLAELKRNSRGFQVFLDLRYDIGVHPDNYIDFECAFSSFHISRLNPQSILDVGSYRHFILGLLAHFQVTTMDVRSRRAISGNEIVLTCDAKNSNLHNDSFDAVVSLCALEHFGLGRYGDEFDLDADKKAFQEMIRVLKPGGHLIFTTTITKAPPCIAFNAHRIYSQEMIKGLCIDLVREDERFYSHEVQDFCSFDQITTEANIWDVYCGCWKKK
jgi:SAM-dependent methyltransferase